MLIWLLLQRAAPTAPSQERPSIERRLLLVSVVVAGTLAALGYTVTLVWLVFRTLLGAALDATAHALALQFLCVALMTAAVAAYHGLVLRRDLQYRASRPARTRVSVYVAAGAEPLVAQLHARTARRLDVVGYLSDEQRLDAEEICTVQERLATLKTFTHLDGAVLMLRPDSASLCTFARENPGQAARHAEPMAPSSRGT